MAAARHTVVEIITKPVIHTVNAIHAQSAMEVCSFERSWFCPTIMAIFNDYYSEVIKRNGKANPAYHSTGFIAPEVGIKIGGKVWHGQSAKPLVIFFLPERTAMTSLSPFQGIRMAFESFIAKQALHEPRLAAIAGELAVQFPNGFNISKMIIRVINAAAQATARFCLGYPMPFKKISTITFPKPDVGTITVAFAGIADGYCHAITYASQILAAHTCIFNCLHRYIVCDCKGVANGN